MYVYCVLYIQYCINVRIWVVETLDKLINEQLRQEPELGLTCSLTKELTCQCLYDDAGCTYSKERCACEDGKIRLLITLPGPVATILCRATLTREEEEEEEESVALGGYAAVSAIPYWMLQGVAPFLNENCHN
jgi:hypothetical protein